MSSSFSAASSGTPQGDTGPAKIYASDTEDYKRAPEAPGGEEVSNQHLYVYSQFEDEAEELRISEASLNSVQPLDAQLELGGPPIELRPGESYQSRDPDNGMPMAVSAQVEALRDIQSIAEEEEPTLQLANSEYSIPAASNETVSSAPIRMPQPLRPQSQTLAGDRYSFTPDGAYLVQISALRSEEAARAAWSSTITAQPALYDGANMDIQRADLGAKGVFYRLRAGAFIDRASADAFCTSIKSQGGACIVVQR